MSFLSRSKAFADNNWNLGRTIQFDLQRVESIVGKGENVGY